MKRTISVLLTICVAASMVMAQNAPVKTMRVAKIDESPPLSELVAKYAPIYGSSEDREIPNILTNSKRSAKEEIDKAGAVDPVWQQAVPSGEAATILTNVEGGSNLDNAAVVGFRLAPPDPNMDVGPNHVIQTINLITTIFNKAGSILLGPFSTDALWAGAGGNCEFNNDGDPIVNYDEAADRWIISQFVFSANQCFAVSTSPDPLGSYFRYEFPTPGNDYPKVGVQRDAYYGTIRNFSGGFNMDAVAWERAAMLAGASAFQITFNLSALDGDCEGVQPIDVDGSLPAPGVVGVFAGHNCGPSLVHNEIEMFNMVPDFNNPPSSTLSGPFPVNVPSFDLNQANIPQPSPGTSLDDLAFFTMYRVGMRDMGSHLAMVLCHTVDVNDFPNHAGMRWYELRDASKTGAGNNWSLFQSGTHAPDNDHRWMGSIAMNSSGDIGMQYTVSSSSTFPSIRVTGRKASDPLGQMTLPEETIIAGTGSQTNTSRWGDYSSLSVDPSNGTTFWGTHEYVQTTGSFNWWTRVFEFEVTPAPPQPFAVRINCGNGPFTTGGGVLFSGDVPYNPPSVPAGFVGGNLFQTNEPISGTTDDKLYSDIHGIKEVGFSYRVNVPAAGNYDVVLHFAAPPFGPDKGIMDILAEGVLILDDFAPEDIVGGWAAHTESFTVNVTDGVLNLRFNLVNKAAFVSAIEVTEATVAPGLAKGRTNNQIAGVPTDFVLHQNHPNPFNPTTNIRFNLPEDGTVTLKIFNMLGEEVNTLVEGYRSAGSHEIQWNARNNKDERVASGIYIYRLEGQGFSDFKKMTLLQ